MFILMVSHGHKKEKFWKKKQESAAVKMKYKNTIQSSFKHDRFMGVG